MHWSGSYADTPGDTGPEEWEQMLADGASWPFIAAAAPLTGDEAAQLERSWRTAMERPRRVRLLTPLPRRVRLRLAARHAVDRTAIRLVNHGHHRAAIRLWRTFGMWGGGR